MSLFARIESDLKTALKARDMIVVERVRFLLAQLQNESIAKRGKGGDGVLTDEEVLVVLRREAKKRKEAITLFKEGGRAELAAKEEGELRHIEQYLPAAMAREEVKALAERAVASGAKGFPAIMKTVMQEAKGRAEGALIAEIVKEIAAHED